MAKIKIAGEEVEVDRVEHDGKELKGYIGNDIVLTAKVDNLSESTIVFEGVTVTSITPAPTVKELAEIIDQLLVDSLMGV